MLGKSDKIITQRRLVYILTLGLFGLAYVIFFTPIPDANRDIGYILFGTYVAKWGDAIAFFYNSSHGSTEKNDTIKKAQPVMD